MIQIKSLAAPATKRKQLGAFYTPENLSRVLTNWAISAGDNLVLEPSFGRCGFLAAARDRLAHLGCEAPRKQIYGCDVDKNALGFLVETLGSPVDTANFRLCDFLDIHPEQQWPFLFDTSIGNPPYIPYQAIPEPRRKELSKRMAAAGVPLGKQASLWAYFVVHAVSFLKPKGRLAWVLPGSFLQANYAEAVRSHLAASFDSVLYVLMHQRFFRQEGTEEETVVLLARDRREALLQTGGAPGRFAEAASLEELSRLITAWEQGCSVGKPLNDRPSRLSISSGDSAIYEELRRQEICKTLGDYLRINIGLVTGANVFFVLGKHDLEQNALNPADVRPVLSKFRAARGLTFTKADHHDNLEAKGKGYLVHCQSLPQQGTALRTYLDRFPSDQLESISTFKKRAIWHATDDGKYPDAFFSAMNHTGPRLVLNKAGINCTNSLHKAFFNAEIDDPMRKLICLSLLTSFSQLSAEFVGRRYGSGVLKHEPREAEKIAILIPNGLSKKKIDAAFNDVDALLRSGQEEKARKRADKLILSQTTGNVVSILEKSLEEVRLLRQTNRYA
ncbi:N-6 DNA methylase [Azospirillum brasilense]|nr:N-6 DNA methylase [Azospirillum brasilense]